MKASKFTGIGLVAMMLSLSLMAQDTKQTLTVPLSEPGKPYKLEVGLVSGSINVIGYSGKEVVIDAEMEHSKKEDRQAEPGMHRISGAQNLDLIAHEKNNTVDITTGMPNKQVNLTIKVPAGSTSIKLSTVNGKSVIASDISGDMEISATNGFIKLTNVSGSVVANSINGNVIVTFKSIDAKAPMAFTTLNGNVDVTFPASLKADVKLRSDRGNIYTDFDMTTDKTEPKATKTVKDGTYRITIEDWVYGKINGGGPQLLMKNMNGNIYIRKAK
jgi:DUF4097 and DUF4098 domain-containing protein YvlB